MAQKKKVLATGIVITYDKKGNIKTMYSPFMEDTVFEEPTIDTLYQQNLKEQLKQTFQW